MFESIDSTIIYEILPDGACSYCGKPAEFIETPDGDFVRNDSCVDCDDYNQEVRANQYGYDL